MQVCPWKARHGNVKAAWKKVLDGLLMEKIDGTFMFVGINVMTICNRYQNVYLVLGDKWRKEWEQCNASMSLEGKAWKCKSSMEESVGWTTYGEN